MNKIKKTITLSKESYTALEMLFAETFGTGQRGTSFQYGLELLGQTADYAMAETVDALKTAVDAAAGIDK